MIITALGESMLAMESLITHVDAIITHSCDKHLCNEADQDLEEAAVVMLLDGEEGSIIGQVDDTGMEGVAFPALEPNDDSIIDISDEE